MPLSFEEMIVHPNLVLVTRGMARAFVERREVDPRLASVFGTQQRWLLAHAAMAIYFRGLAGDGPGLHSGAFLELVEAEKIAARHTAHAFLKEMIHYGVAFYSAETKGSKTRFIGLSDVAIKGIGFWLLLHLEALDAFDGGSRAGWFQRNPEAAQLLQPALADRLLSSSRMRVPKGAFSLFTWLNNGGLVMDWLMLGLQPAEADADRILTSVTSISDIAERLNLSRTHLGRKLRDAEDLGSIGWVGRRGQSTMWLSSAFRDEYLAYQAGKLALVESALESVVHRLGPG
jgi:hypothetical protein